MEYFIIEENTRKAIEPCITSSTLALIDYLFKCAEKDAENHEISIKYKDIEEALNLGHTCVGKNMRLLLNNGLIVKLSTSKYKINNRIMNKIEISTFC